MIKMDDMTKYLNDTVTVHSGDSRDVLKTIPDNSIDSIVTDPPYALVSIVKRFGSPNAAPARDGDVYSRSSSGFMGQQWDTGETAFAKEFWQECLRVLKPGGYVLSFGATRSYHRLACAIEDAGFEIRDCIMWVYGTGFPKSHDVSKGIDKKLKVEGTFGGPKSEAHAGWIERGKLRGGEGHDGYQRPWMDDPEAVDKNAREYIPASSEAAKYKGWGTALKPAVEPIVMARKPVIGTIAENVLQYGTGAINIDGCRVGNETITYDLKGGENLNKLSRPNGNDDEYSRGLGAYGVGAKQVSIGKATVTGRWPANLIHDGSDEVNEAFPISNSARIGNPNNPKRGGNSTPIWGMSDGRETHDYRDSGSASRFFYSAKASKKEKVGNHPTQKPIALMQYLCKLVTPPGGTVLDPFAGTGTTAEGAWREGFSSILIEREEEYVKLIDQRIRTFNDRCQSKTDKKITDFEDE